MNKTLYYKRARDLSRFSRYLWPYWDKQAVLYICMGFSVFIGLLHPYLSRLAIDYALLARDLYIFNLLLIVGIISYLFSVPVEYIQKYARFYLRTRVAYDLRSRFYKHLQSLSLRFARSRPVGEHLYRLGPDLEGVVSLIADTIPSAVVFVVRFVLLLSICLWINWKLTLIILAVSPLIYLHTYYFTQKQYAINKTITERSQDISSQLQEALAQVTLIKIFGKERSEIRRYLQDIISLIRLSIRQINISLLQGQSGRLINAVLSGGLMYYLGYQVIKGRMTPGQLTALSLYLFQLLSAIKSIGGLYKDIVVKFVVMDRVVQTLDADVEVRALPNAIRTWKSEGYIKTENITFGYVRPSPVLHDISFALQPGQTIALIGPSGAGKTTLSYLLMRLYDPWNGQIILDDMNIKTLDIAKLRKTISLAFHDPSLMNRSIKENICFGDPKASGEEIVEAAKIADAHDFIMELQDGYNTHLGREGGRLSQGQKQRIGIARAVVLNPKILILDEAMSSLNADHEQRILQNLRQYRPDMGIIVVSHHHLVVKSADKVIALKNGRLANEEFPQGGIN